jgi:erythromycin esterase
MTTDVVKSWLETEAAHLSTLEPSAPLEDLDFLADVVGNARIVGVGESAHGIHEFYLARHRILRFLVEKLGFRAYVLESGWCEGVAVNEWVHGGMGNLADLQRSGFTYGMGACKEMTAQLEWMRAYNRGGGRGVDFSGMDMIATLATPEPGLRPALAYLDRTDSPAAEYFRREVIPLVERFASDEPDMARYLAIPAADRDRLTALVTDIALLFDDRRIQYISATSLEDYTIARQHVALVKQFDDFIRHFPTTPQADDVHPFADGRMRDRYMAENVAWILEHLGSDARVVVAAHNGHLQRQPMRVFMEGREVTAIPTTLGQYLDAEWSDDYRPIAVTHRAGRISASPPITLGAPDEDSLAALLARGGVDRLLVDLRLWPVDGPLGEELKSVTIMRLNEDYTTVDPRRGFDAVLYVDTTSPYEKL